MAAYFARDYRVLALDLSGHGDSDHRAEYSLTGWTDEVIAVAEHGGADQPLLLLTALRTLAADWDQPRTAAPTHRCD